MFRRAFLSLLILICLAAFGGELRILSTEGERIALTPVVDLRESPTDEARRADELLFEAFGGEMDLVYTGTVDESESPDVWGPSRRDRGYAAYLGPAADNGARAVLFVFIEENGDWNLRLIGVDGSVLEGRYFTGLFNDVFPKIAAVAIESFRRHFPPDTATSVGRGRLLITCDGRGFSASVDGNSVGVVPPEGLELWLSAGSHRLTVYDGDESPLETRLVSIVPGDLVRMEFFFGYDVDTEEDNGDEVGDAVASCLFDAFFAAFCPPAESSGEGDGSWGPEGDEDEEEVWGPTHDGEDEDDDDDDEGNGGEVWAPNP